MSAQMAGPEPAEGEPAYRLTGLIGFCAALLILRILPLRRATALVARLGRHRPPATTAEAQAAVNGARRASRYFPGRAACMENSLAAVLAGLLHRRKTDWCIGARTLPYTTHAWVEAEDTPVGEPADRPYHVLLRV
jgi:hypothetical protein